MESTAIAAVSSPAPAVPKLQAIALRQGGATPTAIAEPPTFVGVGLFATPDEPAYVEGQGFAPDAQRVLDIASLQISLEKYRAAQGRYPARLADLFPAFAPIEQGHTLAAPPLDPQTHQPYAYAPSSDGTSYQLSATLASGKRYTGVQRALR